MLASVIREIIAPVLRECPPECGIVSLTEVDVSRDFSYATVYFSSLKEQELAFNFLEEKRPALQREMGKLYRKRIPILRFRLDSSIEKGNRIDDILTS